MNKFRCLAAAMTLVLLISTATIAGDIQGVGAPGPCDIQRVGCTVPDPGDAHTPGQSTQAPANDTGFDVSIGAWVIAELLSIVF